MNSLVVCGLLLIGAPVDPVAQQPVNASAVADSKFNELAERYRSILQNRPQRGTAFDQWHRLYLDAGRLDELVAAVAKEASDKPDDFAAQMVLGLVSERCGRADQAAQAYARAEQLAPENYYPPYLRGSLLAQETRLDGLRPRCNVPSSEGRRGQSCSTYRRSSPG